MQTEDSRIFFTVIAMRLLFKQYSSRPQCKSGSVYSYIGVEAQSTVGGGGTFLPEKYVWKINKMPEFYMIFAREIIKIPEFVWYLSEKSAKFSNFTRFLHE